MRRVKNMGQTGAGQGAAHLRATPCLFGYGETLLFRISWLRGKCKRESGAFSGTAFHGNCALVSLRDPFDHGKPQAGTLPFPGASGGIYLIKTVPYFIQLILFNADSVIGNRAGNVSAAGGKGNERMAVLASIGDAVGNQVDEKAHQHGFISAKQDIGLDIGFQRDVSCNSKAALFFRYDFGQLAQVQDFGMKLLLSAVCAGQGEELGNQVGHFAGLVRYGPDAASGFLRGGIFPGSIFALGEDDGYGGAELVGDIRGKLFFIFKGGLELIHHTVEGMGHFVDLILSFPYPYPLGEVVPFADLPGSLSHVGQGGKGFADDQVAARRDAENEKRQENKRQPHQDMEGGIRLCLGGDAAYPQIAVAVNFLAVIVDIPEILAGGRLLDFIHDKHGGAVE